MSRLFLPTHNTPNSAASTIQVGFAQREGFSPEEFGGRTQSPFLIDAKPNAGFPWQLQRISVPVGLGLTNFEEEIEPEEFIIQGRMEVMVNRVVRFLYEKEVAMYKVSKSSARANWFVSEGFYSPIWFESGNQLEIALSFNAPVKVNEFFFGLGCELEIPPIFSEEEPSSVIEKPGTIEWTANWTGGQYGVAS